MQVPYKDALTAVFIEGWLFILLSVTGARQALIRLLPKTLSLSMAAGIGLFLAHIGLQASEGLGVVTADPATLVTLGVPVMPHAATLCSRSLALLHIRVLSLANVLAHECACGAAAMPGACLPGGG